MFKELLYWGFAFVLLYLTAYESNRAFQYRRAYESAIGYSESLSRTYGNKANAAFKCHLTGSSFSAILE